MRVLTLSSLFPSAAQPSFGVFVERQTLGLAALPDMAVEVAAPIGLPPWPLSLHPHYRPRAGLPPAEDWKGVRVHRPRFRMLPRIGEAGAARSMARALRPLVRTLQPDVIDAEFFWPDGVAAMHLGLPFSIKARGADILYWSRRPAVLPQLLAAAEAADGLLAVSFALREAMIALGMPGEKIAVHYTGVDRDLFHPRHRGAAKARLGVSGPLLLTAGALIPRKGQRFAIEALRHLPDATLLLAGDGPDRGALESQARAAGLADRARFLGSMPHEALPELFAAADLLVQPSDSEGLANVWVEALASGTPVVTCDAGGAREALDRPEAGRIVPRDPAAIADAVRAILADPPDPERVRAASDRFSWPRNAAELGDHLRRIAAAAPRRSSAPRP